MEIRHDEAINVGPPNSEYRTNDRALWRCEDERLIASAGAAADHVRAFSSDGRPALIALYLGGNFQLLATELLGRENAGQCRIKSMRIISQASRLGAIGFILVHHDRSRTSGPSAAELKATKELRRLGEDLGIYLLDHLVIGHDRLGEVAA